MSRLYLVRHGRAAADFGSHVDPPLDPLGQAQAEKIADDLAPKGPLPLLTSPLRRTRETASPLERRWGTPAQIESRVGEIPSRSQELARRAHWLRGVMKRRWRELDESLRNWRAGVIQALCEQEADAVVISHFIAINVAVGQATGDDQVTCFRPDHCSCTLIEVVAGRLELLELGAEGATQVL